MDEYLESVAAKHLYMHYGFNHPDDIKPHLAVMLSALVQDNRDVVKHIFYNCRMFHKSSCDECQFRFNCYTN